VAPHELPSLRRSLFDVATSVVPYLALSVVMYLCLNVSIWITLALTVPAAGFLLRTFIVFHDCAHGSFLPTKRANVWFGRFTGLLVLQPFGDWRHKHAIHHGTAGDLDRRGTGDVMTLTVDEYMSRTWKQRLG
jgi:omega-6 fatty acid desaturase (delta-12 desaturase)